MFPVWLGHKQVNKLLFLSLFRPDGQPKVHLFLNGIFMHVRFCFLFEHVKLRLNGIIGGTNECCSAGSNNRKNTIDYHCDSCYLLGTYYCFTKWVSMKDDPRYQGSYVFTTNLDYYLNLEKTWLAFGKCGVNTSNAEATIAQSTFLGRKDF